MRRAARVASGLLVVLGIAAVAAPQVAVSQQPTDAHVVFVSINVLTPPQEVPMLGSSVYDITVNDLSVDRIPDGEGFLHNIFLDLRYVDPLNSTGWSAFINGPKQLQSRAGHSFRTSATVIASPTVQSQLFSFIIGATLYSTGPGGPVRDEQVVLARLRPFSIATVDLPGAVQQIGPFEDVSIPVNLRNEGQYPDAFVIRATGPEGWFVTVQPRVTLQPGEERTLFIHATSPATRVFVPQEVAVISLVVRSERDPGASYERATVVVLEGTHIPEYWAPLLGAGAVAVVAVGTKAREDFRRRSKEQGRPVPPRMTPAQAVMLADLKRRDPERHGSIIQRRKFAMKARERAFAAVRGRRGAVERTLLDRQHRQVREAKAAERAALRDDEERERELARQKALLLREKERRERALAAQASRAEAKRRREEERRARLAAPNARRLERERRARERKLRLELARKQRVLEVEERKRRLEVDKKRRILERRRKDAERRARRAGKRPPKPRPENKGGLFGRKKPPMGGEGGDEGPAE